LRGVYAALAAFFILTAYAAPVSVSQVKEQALSGYLYYVFFESSPASSCATPSVNTQLSFPPTSSSFVLKGGQTLCLWATAQGVFSGGTCVVILYASSTAPGSITFTLSVTNSAGVPIATLGSGSLSTSTTQQELSSTFSCSSFSVNGYLELSLTGGGAGKTKYTVYFGGSTPTDFQVVKSADSA
jgi:hypothetical protein